MAMMSIDSYAVLRISMFALRHSYGLTSIFMKGPREILVSGMAIAGTFNVHRFIDKEMGHISVYLKYKRVSDADCPMPACYERG